MKNINKNLLNERGVISIITLLAISTIALAIVTTVASSAVSELQMVNSGSVIDKTFYAAEAGLNNGLYLLGEGVIPDPNVHYTFDLDGVNVDVVISGSGYGRTVHSEATDSGGRKRILEIDSTSSTFAGGFENAIHGGANGIYLENGSEIIGSVHSNGGIYPDSSGSTGYINGSATVSLQFTIDSVEVTGNVEAYQVIDSIIDGHLIFGGSVDTATEVVGSACGSPGTNPECEYIAGRELGIRPMPLTLPVVEGFKTKVEDAIIAGDGVNYVIDPDNCPSSVPDPTTTYCINSTAVTLGTGKIVGDLYVSGSVANKGILTLDGEFLYVTGKITLGNNTTIKINSSNPNLAKRMITVIADNIINVNNNTNVIAYVDPVTTEVDDKSFILLTTTSNSFVESAPAVYASNNSNSIVFAAVAGMLRVKNNGDLVAASAEELYLENNATVTYNPNLSSFVIGSGGGEEVGTAFGSWREL